MSFQLKSDRKETENKTIRFPLPLIEKINAALIGRDTTFSGFVIQACEYALENMEPSEESWLMTLSYNKKGLALNVVVTQFLC